MSSTVPVCYNQIVLVMNKERSVVGLLQTLGMRIMAWYQACVLCAVCVCCVRVYVRGMCACVVCTLGCVDSISLKVWALASWLDFARTDLEHLFGA